MALRPPPKASSAQVYAWFRENSIGERDGVEYLAALQQHFADQLTIQRRISISAAYLAYLSNPEQKHLRAQFECVSSGMSVIADEKHGSMLPCCNAVICRGALASYGPGTVCPAKNCDAVIDTEALPPVDKEQMVTYTEVLAAFKLLKTGGNALPEMRDMIGDQDVSVEMPLNRLIATGATQDAVMDLARSIALRHRDVLKEAATGVLRSLSETVHKDVPKPVVSAGARNFEQPSPKRPRTEPTSPAKRDDLVPAGKTLPPKSRLDSEKYGPGKTVMLTRFNGKCQNPQCKAPLVANQSVVSPIDSGEPDAKPKWMCSMCVFGMTSAQVFESLTGGGGAPSSAAPSMPPPKREEECNVATCSLCSRYY